MLDKKEAKELTLEVWQYLADHPEINDKYALPMYNRIADMLAECPLCQWSREQTSNYKHNSINCDKCPLFLADQGCCEDFDCTDTECEHFGHCEEYDDCEEIFNCQSLYEQWNIGNEAQRKQAAQGIVDIVKEW